jgi:hypothetical protein
MTAVTDSAAVETWFRHIDHLARVIGPRGATTAAEAAAADYVREQFEQLGFNARVETFRSGTSGFRPFAVALAVALVAFALHPVAGRVSGVVSLAVFALAMLSAILELQLRSGPLALLQPKKLSRNVWTAVQPVDQARRRVAILGHIDSNRTPLMFSQGWTWLLRVLTPVSILAIIALSALFVRSVAVQTSGAYLIGLIPATVLLLVCAVMAQSDFSPYTAGANDNASGAGLLPAIAADLRTTPLAQTEVWLVATGCEEVGCVGARAFYDIHRHELRDADVIVVDGIGGSGPCYVSAEGMPLPRRYDAHLLALAGDIASERPELGAYSGRLAMGYSEGLPALQRGLRALTVWGLTKDGDMPHWHQASDTIENIDRDALARNFAFIRGLIERIDLGVAGGTNP